MGLLDRGMAWLNRTLTDSAGVSIVYVRGAHTATIPAVVGRTLFAQTNPGSGANRASVEWGDRDYLIAVSDLAFAGSPITPTKGDRITQIVNGVSLVFELTTPTGEPVWRYSDPERTTYRVHCKRVS